MKLTIEQQRDANRLLKYCVVNAIIKIKESDKRIPQNVINGSWDLAVQWKERMERINVFLDKPLKQQSYSLRELVEKKKSLEELIEIV